MRTLLRYLVVSGLAVALAWGLFVVRVGDRTVFGHLRGAADADVGNAWTRLKSGLDDRLDELNGATDEARKKKQAVRAKAKALADKQGKKAPVALARTATTKPKAADARDADKRRAERASARGVADRTSERGSDRASERATERVVATRETDRATTASARAADDDEALDRAMGRASDRATTTARETATRKADEARVQRLGEAQKLARAMQRADAAAPPKTTRIDEHIPSGGHGRVDALLGE